MLPHIKKTKMKLYQLILLVLTTGFISCQKGHNKTTITGKIVGEIPEIIEYTIPLNGISFFGFEDSVQPDSSGNFQIELEIEKPCFIEFFKRLRSLWYCNCRT